MIRSYNRDYVTLDYQLLNGHTRVVRYHRDQWQLAQHVAFCDEREGLADPRTACAVMAAIVDVAFRPFQPRPRRTYLEAATALVMHVLGVKDEDCGEGEVK